MKTNMFLPSLLLLISSFSVLNAQKMIEIKSTEAYTMLQKDARIIVLDVRTAQEYSQGFVKGAINIDMHQTDAMDRINTMDKNAKYLVYCRTKNRSEIVVNNMIQNGFNTVYQMTDGITGWNLNSLPVEK